MKGPYLNQKLPGMTPEIFAPGIINTIDQNHSCVTVSPDGRFFFFSNLKNGMEDIYWVNADIIEDLKHGGLK